MRATACHCRRYAPEIPPRHLLFLRHVRKSPKTGLKLEPHQLVRVYKKSTRPTRQTHRNHRNTPNHCYDDSRRILSTVLSNPLFTLLFSEIIRKLAQIGRPLVACARRHFEVMFAKNAFNFYVKRAQVDSPWSGLLEAYSLRFPAGRSQIDSHLSRNPASTGGHARDRYHSRRPQRPINPPHVSNFRQFDTCTAANPSRLVKLPRLTRVNS
jgi:hypothetical protein